MTRVLYEEKFNLLLDYIKRLESKLIIPSRIGIKGKERSYNVEIYKGTQGLVFIQVYTEDGKYWGTLTKDGPTQQIEYTNVIDDILTGYLGDIDEYFG